MHPESLPSIAPAAFIQERLWLLHQYLPNKAVYNIPTALHLRGPLDISLLQSALDSLVQRHEPLRTRFTTVEGSLVQLIYPPGPISFSVEDLTCDPPDRLSHLLWEHSRQPFHLDRENPIHATLFKMGDLEHTLLISTHHIASDEWSVRILLSELKHLYLAQLDPSFPPLPELPIQYADYAAWKNEWIQSPDSTSQLAFWKNLLTAEISPVELPLDRPRPSNPSHEGARERFPFPASLNDAVLNLSRTCQTTVFNVLFAAFQALLARYTSSQHILTGTVVACRNQIQTEPLIGFFINLLAIPSHLPPSTTFRQLVEQVKEAALAAYAHQDVPFDQVVAEINPVRSASRMPLTQVLFTIQNTILDHDSWGPLEVDWIDVYTGTSKFDLNVTIEQNFDRFALLAEYSTDLFDAATIRSLSGHYTQLITSFAVDPTVNVWSAEILSPAERDLILHQWNATASAYPRDSTIHDLFAGEAAASPDAVALKFLGGRWTYRDLAARAATIASFLGTRHITSEARIGLCLERGPELIAALLAILKAGGCYVPLDPDYPVDRLRLLCQDAGATIILTSEKCRRNLPDTFAEIILLEKIPSANESSNLAPSIFPPVAAANAAYVMYTSGSTGQPKGVVVTHRNVIRLVKGADFISFSRDEVFLQYAPISFDASTLEIWGPLLNGGTLAIMPPQKASIQELGHAIAQFHVTTLWLTTGLFNLAVDEEIDALGGLRQLITGGDVASPKHFRRFLEHHSTCRLYNGYGPTENTTFTTVARITLEDLADSASAIVPIGHPISNTEVYLLDSLLQPVPIGVVGELYAGGDGLAREYLHAPELTTQKFIPHPFKFGERLYRTGDLARFLRHGAVQFLGRLDHQVKIRGFRIELAEIEEALRSHPAIRQIVVVARELRPNQKALVAYWSPHTHLPIPDQAQLRGFLKQSLPDYMVPSAFVRMNQLPLDPNGKVDRNALPNPAEQPHPVPPASDENELTELEQKLLTLWRQVLNQPTARANENFFDLGGQSLLATQFVSRIRQSLNIDLPLGAIFDHGTVSELATFLTHRSQS